MRSLCPPTAISHVSSHVYPIWLSLAIKTGIPLFYDSCRSLIRRQGDLLPYNCHSYSWRLVFMLYLFNNWSHINSNLLTSFTKSLVFAKQSEWYTILLSLSITYYTPNSCTSDIPYTLYIHVSNHYAIHITIQPNRGITVFIILPFMILEGYSCRHILSH